MPSQATLLYRLQGMDNDTARHRTRLKDIETILSSDATVALASRQLETAQAELKPWQTRARDLELEIKSVVEKVRTSDADLYGGRIRNPKALQELQEEIASLKRHQGQLEDTLLEAMMEVEDHQRQIAAAQQTLTDARAAHASQQTDLLTERQRLESELAKLQPQRQNMASSIEPSNLAAYEKLRPRFRGQVVAVLHEDGCSICGVEQTSMNAQQVRLGRTLAYCESCGRILAVSS